MQAVSLNPRQEWISRPADQRQKLEADGWVFVSYATVQRMLPLFSPEQQKTLVAVMRRSLVLDQRRAA